MSAQLEAAEVQAYARRAIAQLNNAVRTIRIHEPTHASVTAVLEPLAGTLNTLAQHFDGAVRIEAAADVVFFNEVRFRITATSAAQVELLQSELAARRIGGLSFARPVRVESLRTYLAAFARKAESAEELDRQTRNLIALGRDFGVELLEGRALVNADAAVVDTKDQRTFALETYAHLIVAFDTFMTALEDGADPMEGRLEIVHLVQDLIDITETRVDHLLSLPLLRRASASAFGSAVPRYASAHAANTCVWAVLIGRVLELNKMSLLDLGISALLGDVGFALLPQALTEREVELDEPQRRSLRAAMTRAAGALMGQGRVNDAMQRHMIVAYEHHHPYVDPETGTPAQLHVLSRITAVACAFDAMTTARPWRPALTQKQAVAELMRTAGEHFDPIPVNALANLVSTYGGFMTFAATS